jgi:hypothetical protein
MDSTVKSRPNYYETLGLKPTASDDEIASAFARQMLSPRPMLDAAQIGIAYAVLRDPIKRRDYDRSLGLNAKPEPLQWTYAAPPRWAPFIASAAPKPLVKPSAARAAPPEPFVEPPPPKPEARAEPKLVSPIVAARRELEAATEPYIPDFVAVHGARAERSRDGGNSGIDWKYPAFAVGSLVVMVGLLGAWAGMAAGTDAEAGQAEPATTFALPKAAARPSAATEPPVPVAKSAETQMKWSVRGRGSVSRNKRNATRQRPTAWAEQQVREGQSGESGTDMPARDPLAPESSAAQPIAAKLPLPNRVIARTIERIGYACGQVASTVEGDAGVYKVTCTSGHSYQATPVRGRYRFRRLSGEAAP